MTAVRWPHLRDRAAVVTDGITARQGAPSRLHFRARDVYHVLSGTGTVTVARSGHPDTVIEVSGTPNLYPLVEGDLDLDETPTLTYSAGVSAYTFSLG